MRGRVSPPAALSSRDRRHRPATQAGLEVADSGLIPTASLPPGGEVSDGVSAASAAVGSMVLIAVAFSRTELRNAWLLAALACVASILYAVPSSLLQELERWRATSTITLVTGAGGLSATVVVLLNRGRITGIFVVQAVSVVASPKTTGALVLGLVCRSFLSEPPESLHRRER